MTAARRARPSLSWGRPGRGPRALASALTGCVVLTLALSGCTGATDPLPGRDDRSPVSLAWRDVTPPEAARDGFRPREGTLCGGRWVVAGSDLVGDRTRPAAWVSRDLTAWHELRFRSHELYARQSIVSTVGCRAGRLAMLAEKSGGAHGLPRVRLWRETTAGTLRSLPVPTELFSGPSAVSVNRLVGARSGWLITGSRTSGAAVWSSRTARSFTLHDGQPGLASDRRGATTAYDEVALGGSGAPSWLLVGALRAAGRPSRPVAFAGSPGRGWSREPMPSTASFATAERVMAGSNGLVAVGLHGDGFASWTRDDREWTRGPDFAPRAEDAGSAAFVSGLASYDGALWATLSDGATFELWRGEGSSWEQVDLPLDVPVTGSNAVTVVAGRDRLLVLVSDGAEPRVYAAPSG